VDAEPALIATGLREAGCAEARRLTVALSGGPDSVALLDLAQRALELPDVSAREVAAIHVNHGLQPESDAWAAFCEELCRQRGIALTVVPVTVVATGSVEANARDARYRAFADALESGGVLLLAHHFDDQVETWLFRTLRGDARRTMPPHRQLGGGTLVRPLLGVSRQQLLDHLCLHKLDHVVDPSNADTSYSRNFLREAVLPLLRQHDSGFEAKVAAAMRSDTERDELLAALAELDRTPLETDAGVLRLARLAAIPAPRARNVLRHWLSERGFRQPTTRALDAAIATVAAGRRVDIRVADTRLVAYQGLLHAIPRDLAPFEASGRRWQGESELLLGSGRLVAARVSGGIDARSLRLAPIGEGQRLRVHRDGPRRLVRDLMREAGIPPWERERIPLLFDGERLIGVPGFRDSSPVVGASSRVAEGQTGWEFRWWPST
tara:strand:+ start:6816 stop:8126 length:1311 start_codon:yes stop_codon:yes gene_type:complete